MLTQIGNLKVKQWQDHKWLIIESDKLAHCHRFITSPEFASFAGIIISRDLGYKESSLSFLEQLPFLKSCAISDAFSDMSGIYALHDLEVLQLSENKGDIDLSRFGKLRELSLDWGPKIAGFKECLHLRKLTIGSFNPRTDGLMELPNLPALTELSIVKSTVTNLHGIGRFTKLRSLELVRMSKLVSLDDLTCPRLETLLCSICRKLRNHAHVKRLKGLRVLKFNNCGQLPSIGFIKELPNLRLFTFVETIVADGDITPCLGLKLVGFTDAKHYSHTLDDVRKAIVGVPS